MKVLSQFGPYYSLLQFVVVAAVAAAAVVAVVEVCTLHTPQY